MTLLVFFAISDFAILLPNLIYSIYHQNLVNLVIPMVEVSQLIVLVYYWINNSLLTILVMYYFPVIH